MTPRRLAQFPLLTHLMVHKNALRCSKITFINLISYKNFRWHFRPHWGARVCCANVVVLVVPRDRQYSIHCSLFIVKIFVVCEKLTVDHCLLSDIGHPL